MPPAAVRGLRGGAPIAAQHPALDRRRCDSHPQVARKPACTVADPFESRAVDPALKTRDWEVETGAVIGRLARQVPDVSALRLRLTLNGCPMQDGVASDMLFGIAEQIAHRSRHVELRPGDPVRTGSPAGFGSHHGRCLLPGDVIEAEVEGLGQQRVGVKSTP